MQVCIPSGNSWRKGRDRASHSQILGIHRKRTQKEQIFERSKPVNVPCRQGNLYQGDQNGRILAWWAVVYSLSDLKKYKSSVNFGLLFSHGTSNVQINMYKWVLATFWAIFSQTHLGHPFLYSVYLREGCQVCSRMCFFLQLSIGGFEEPRFRTVVVNGIKHIH
jgi:hypothetical protein